MLPSGHSHPGYSLTSHTHAIDVLKEVRIEAITTKLGATPPTSTTRAVGASGTVLKPVLSFSSTTQNDCYFVFHCPVDKKAGGSVRFHLMWHPGSAWTTGNYLWKLEYLVMAENGATLLSGSPTTISKDVTPSNATTNREDEYTDAITLEVNQIMVCHFYRDIADTGNAIGEVSFFEIEYEADKLGETV